MFISNHELMILAAHMYYEEGMTHQAIADKLNTSRITITRILKQAREQEIVRFIFSEPLPERFQVAQELERAYGLQNAYVVPTEDRAESTLERVGQVAVAHLAKLIQPGIRIGFGWSSSIGYLTHYLDDLQINGTQFTINDLAGTMLGHDNPYSIASKVSEVTSAAFEPLPVPAVLSSEAARNELAREAIIASHLQNARQCDVAILGIGAANSGNTMVETGHLTEEEMLELNDRGAVGEVLLRFFDIHGSAIGSSLDNRLITLSWDDLHNIPYITILGIGHQKIDPIRGIIAAGLCQCLITDELTARQLLA